MFVLFISDNEKDNDDEEDDNEGGENKNGEDDTQSANINLDEKPVLRPCEDNEWTLICSTVQQWNDTISLYENSTDKNEKILLRGLKELNEVMPDIFEEKVFIDIEILALSHLLYMKFDPEWIRQMLSGEKIEIAIL